MSFAQKTLHASVVAYLSALFGCLAFALIKMDFTGYPFGKAGLLIVMIMTSVVAYRFMIILARNLKLQNQPL
jgi:positive regulator of sigma E activity